MPRLLIFHIRRSRNKARALAVAEAAALLRDWSPHALAGGPYGEQADLFWVKIDADAAAHLLAERLNLIGYSDLVRILEPIPETDWRRGRPDLVRWESKPYRVELLFQEDPHALRERAPDRRPFTITAADGSAKPVRGYRGDGSTAGRRALPVCDAKMLVNLVQLPADGTFLDPFAGAGGVLLEARRPGWKLLSGDIDRIVAPGLRTMSDLHLRADAGRLPLRDESVDAAATEPPYHPSLQERVIQGLGEIARVAKPRARLALLCAAEMADPLAAAGECQPLQLLLAGALDRKGSPCHVLLWEKQ